jgi:hypothetical protein
MAPRTNTRQRIQAAYDTLSSDGRTPTKVAVAALACTTPDTVRMYWDDVTGTFAEVMPTQIQVAAPRRCLGCSSTFPSKWNGNRICGRCRDLDAWISSTAEYSMAF